MFGFMDTPTLSSSNDPLIMDVLGQCRLRLSESEELQHSHFVPAAAKIMGNDTIREPRSRNANPICVTDQFFDPNIGIRIN